MTPLQDLLVKRIRSDGPLPVDHYMQLVTQHPEYGYYRKVGAIGRQGDFITAPEISQMFGELIGFWCADLWLRAGKPNSFTLLELGPGRGTLMADMLRVTAAVPGFRQAARVHLLETNETLRAQQQAALTDLCEPVWVAGLNDLPEQPCFAVANEFFDSLPVRQFERTPDGWAERVVVEQDATLAFGLTRPDPALAVVLKESATDPVGSTVEVSPLAEMMVGDLARHIKQQGGAALIIDYGYSRRPHCGTLQANAKHSHVSPLERPGEVDVTAHVDFTRLLEAASAAGMKLQGPCSQGDFLRQLGIATRAEQLGKNVDVFSRKKIRDDMERLTSEAGMGSLFKVAALRHPDWPRTEGFDG